MKRIIGIPWSKINKNKNKDKKPEDAEGEGSNSQSEGAGAGGTSSPGPAARAQPEQKPAPPTLEEIIPKMDTKAAGFEQKVQQCEDELKKLLIRIRAAPEGSVKNTLKAKAQAILQRKKRYEQQAETAQQQSFNIEQTTTAISSTKESGFVMKALKKGVKALKREQKKVDLDTVEDLHDELGELLEATDDVQGALGADLPTTPLIDDKELEEQLALLGNDILLDDDSSYLDAAAGSRLQPGGNTGGIQHFVNSVIQPNNALTNDALNLPDIISPGPGPGPANGVNSTLSQQ